MTTAATTAGAASTFALDVSPTMTIAFVALLAAVVAQNIALIARAAPAGSTARWRLAAAVAAAAWLALHFAVAASGILEADTTPPRLVFYLPPTLLIGVVIAYSPVGTRLAGLPLGLLVAAQAFRLPLEVWLHALAGAGALPIQMTWSGLNFDVVTGASAAAIALTTTRKPPPRALVWGWNAMGFALLVTVVTIAVLSTPTALRRFTEGPAMLLPYNAPFNGIVCVHVFTAFVGHLVVLRALLRRPGPTDA